MSISVKGVQKLEGEDRYYEWNGERYPSVTTILKYCVPKPALATWKNKQLIGTTLDNISEFEGRDREAGVKRIIALHKDDTTKAGIGSEVHAFAEASANGWPTPEPSPEAEPYFRAYERFQYDVKPKYIATELTVYNRTYGFAGTGDIFAKVFKHDAVIDIKTGKSVWPEVALQCSAYANGEFAVDSRNVRTEAPRVDRGYVLHLSPNGYELRRLDIGDTSFSAFCAALDIYNWLRLDSKYAVGGIIAEGTDD